MAWLRIDDAQVLDSRIGELTDPEYRAHAALVQYVGREHRDDGIYHVDELRHAAYMHPSGPRRVTSRQHARLVDLGLVTALDDYTQEEREHLAEQGVDVTPRGAGWHRISRWEVYQPPRDLTAAERQRRKRERDRERAGEQGTRGSSPRARGGSARGHEGGQPDSSPTLTTAAAPAGNTASDEPNPPTQAENPGHVTRDSHATSRVSHAPVTPRARATRVNGTKRNVTKSSSRGEPAAPAADENDLELLRERMVEAGWFESQIAAGLEEPARAEGWLDRAAGDDVARPGAFAWAGFKAGGDPPQLLEPGSDVNQAAARWLQSPAWDESFDEAAVREELDRIGRSTRTTGELDMDGAVTAWRALRDERYGDDPLRGLAGLVGNDDERRAA